MEAKDTVMSDGEIQKSYKWCYKLDEREIGDFMDMATRAVAQTQAEITWQPAFDEGKDEGKEAGIREVVETVQEMVRLLGKVVPADQNSMIEWVVKSQDSVYTNTGAAYFIGQAKLKEWGIE